MKNLIFFLEEPSAREMLKRVLPKFISTDEINYKYIVFEGKQDLEKNIERKLKNYLAPDSYFLIMRDKDSGDCFHIKNKLLEKVKRSDKINVTLVRIACHELETFYLGDLEAVEKGLLINNLSRRQLNRKFRNPDLLSNPAEELKKLTKDEYQKISGSRKIGKYLKIDGSNKSHSFNILIDGIKKLIRI